MPRFKSLMDVFKLLEKSNCRKCNEKTCMAFAAAVFGGRRPLSDCPRLDPRLARQVETRPEQWVDNEQKTENPLAGLKARLRQVDFADAAGRIGAVWDGKKLVLKVMGKDFGMAPDGTVFTDIHANPWVTAPVINYILHCKGIPVAGNWVPLRELPSGGEWYRLFGQRCEKPMKKVADAYPELFGDLVELLGGQPANSQFQSDVALVLYPLPLIPLLVCYWHAEDGMGSDLNLFFDTTAEDNLSIDGLYTLGAGITRMFEKLALRHGTR
ncbi:MAG: Fe-S cluster protein [Deltaproteobacteria bacterium]|nr:MAG: Fe-S cluster protein [Deltaproteobacteria bacterium]